ncbi:hypothetical protein B0H13DRAFT_2331292 [Mycena leptocephala]|nr:hypothetical protein B0H13DRAFT_2331292 [Mycena leptocephala]
MEEVAEGQGQGPDPNDTSTEGTRPDANAKARNHRPKRADKDGSCLDYFSPHTDHVPAALPVDRLLIFITTKGSVHRHKSFFTSPTLWAQSAVHPNHLVQDAGGFVITLKLGARPASALTSEEETFPCCLRRPARSISRVARRRKWDSGGWIHFPLHLNDTRQEVAHEHCVLVLPSRHKEHYRPVPLTIGNILVEVPTSVKLLRRRNGVPKPPLPSRIASSTFGLPHFYVQKLLLTVVVPCMAYALPVWYKPVSSSEDVRKSGTRRTPSTFTPTSSLFTSVITGRHSTLARVLSPSFLPTPSTTSYAAVAASLPFTVPPSTTSSPHSPSFFNSSTPSPPSSSSPARQLAP